LPIRVKCSVWRKKAIFVEKELLSYMAETFRTCFKEAIGTLTFELKLACPSSNLKQHTLSCYTATRACNLRVREYWRLFYKASPTRTTMAPLLQLPTLADLRTTASFTSDHTGLPESTGYNPQRDL
jgi:hypothetical protein